MNHAMINSVNPFASFDSGPEMATGLLGYYLRNSYPQAFSNNQALSLRVGNLPKLIKENYINIPAFNEQKDLDTQSANSSAGWVETEDIQLSDSGYAKKENKKSEAIKSNSPKLSEEEGRLENLQEIDNLEIYPHYKGEEYADSPSSKINPASKKISKPLAIFSPRHLDSQQDRSITTEYNRKSLYNRMRSKRNPWKPSEDAKLLELINVYGESWAMISSKMVNRTGKQVRDRYLNILRPNLKKGEWTPQEDKLLVTLSYQIGHKWSLIAKHMPGRSEAQVKNRFYSHTKKRLEANGVSNSDANSEMEIDESRDSLTEESSILAKTELQENKDIKLENSEPKLELDYTKVEPDELSPPVRCQRIPTQILPTKVVTEEKERIVDEKKWGSSVITPNSLEAIHLGHNTHGYGQGPQSIGYNHQKHLNEMNLRARMLMLRNAANSMGHRVFGVNKEVNNLRELEIKRPFGLLENSIVRPEVKMQQNLGEPRTHPINEKEVDMVLQILARYYEQNEAQKSIQDSTVVPMLRKQETQVVDKFTRLQQLELRKMNLEFLLNRTLQEMDKIQYKQ